MSGQDAAEYWQARYAERDQIWSGKPNDALVAAVEPLLAGRALDLGCGEGGDSVWLAKKGWQVTAVDISATAIDRAKRRAEAGDVPDDRIRWVVEDLSSWQPTDTYDLVSACFLHSTIEFPRTTILRRAADAVVAGGHLLVVGHTEAPPWAAHDHEHEEDRFLGPGEELANLDLDPDEWQSEVSEVRTREAVGPDGAQATLRDTVVLLMRR